mmetsp:Transcript_20858/g.43998  ORF Transcript_20858/g.43998 Transcript_20858/m.43998 type:complete len:446 (-) Transcript_20858:362-1699(-)
MRHERRSDDLLLDSEERRLVVSRCLVSHQVEDGGCDVGESGVRQVVAEDDIVGEALAADKDRDGRQRVARERQQLAVLGGERLVGLLGALHHVVGVAVVGRDDEDTVELVDRVEKVLEAAVAELARSRRGRKVARVANHVGVGVVYAQHVVPAALQRGDGRVGDLARFHQRLLVEDALIRWDLNVRFELLVKVARAVAVPEKGDVAELLRLGARKRAHAVVRSVLARRLGDRGRRHQVSRRQLEVAVVLHQANEVNLWHALAIELVELLTTLKGLGDLKHAVRAKVEDDDGVIVLDRADWLAVAVDDDERPDVLVGHVTFLERLVRLHRARLLGRRVAEDVRAPSLLHDAPVGFVPVHRHDHAPAARRDLGVAALQLAQHLLQLRDKPFARVVRHVAAVCEHVAANLLRAVLRRLLHHLVQLVASRMHAAVGKEANEVDGILSKG